MSQTIRYSDTREWLKIGGQSQEERRFNMENKHMPSLKKMTLQKREELYGTLSRGTNVNGGVYGKNNQDVKFLRTLPSFYNAGKTMRVASFDWTHQGDEGWGSQVQDPIRA